MHKTRLLAVALLVISCFVPVISAQDADDTRPLLSVKEIMNGIITPTTSTIWGAYELQTDAEWQDVSNAALAVIAAGDLLRRGGAEDGEAALAAEADWQRMNAEMIAAARLVLDAVEQRDEEALFAAGNDALYPPCESCHQQYQTQ